MSSGAVAERYAQAIFELGSEQAELLSLRDQLTEFAVTVRQNGPLSEALVNPLFPAEQRAALIKTVADKVGVSPLGVRCLLLIARRGRLSQLSGIVTRLSEMVDQREGILRASVVTATEMPESYFESLTQKLQEATDKKVVLERSVDPELIGGAVAQLGDSVLDVSVRGRLRQFEQQVLSALVAGTA